MRKELIIRKVRTASGALAVQLIRYDHGKRVVIRHIGSSHTDEELAALYRDAEIMREQLCNQLSLFSIPEEHAQLLHAEHLQLASVTHCFAYTILRDCAQICGLSSLHSLYQDLALMRIVEPASKLRTIELLKRYFDVSYAERSVYRLLPQLIEHKDIIPDFCQLVRFEDLSQFAVAKLGKVGT